MVRLKGPDVSDNNGRLNWTRMKPHIDFAMIRLGYGSDLKSQDDKEFERNVAECERLGIPWGPYLYSYALTDVDLKSEIAHARRKLKGKTFAYPLGFDMEDADHYKEENGMPPDHKLVDFCYTFLSTLEADGHYVSLYANEEWLNSKLNSARLDKWDKWVAQWGNKCTYKGDHGMWQFTNKEHVDGAGIVDMSYAFYNYPEITGDHPQHRKTKHETYTVRSGDYLSAIGNKLGLDWEEIAHLNHIESPYTIYPGQKLKLPSGHHHRAWKTYTVRSGDFLIKIAKHLNVDWHDLAKWNHVTPPYTIYKGQKLRYKN